MSIRIMSQVFEIDGMAPTHRLILLALADHADDQGRCYPSIKRLCDRTGLKERAMQANLRQLEQAGYVSVETNGGPKGCNVYFVRATPAADAPPQEMHPASDAPNPRISCTPTPARDAPEPSGNHQEPSGVNNAREVAGILERWASPDAVTSFIAYRRKTKAKALTATAAKRLANQLSEIFNAGGDTDDALGMAEERGWQTIKAAWYFRSIEDDKGNCGKPNGTHPGAHRPGAGMAQAFAAVAERRSRGAAAGGQGGGGSF